MADKPKKPVDQRVKSGPKPRPPDAGWVVFEVTPDIYQHLEYLVPRSGLGEDINQVAQSLFGIEVRKSMKDPARHVTHPSTWYVEKPATPSDEEPEE